MNVTLDEFWIAFYMYLEDNACKIFFNNNKELIHHICETNTKGDINKARSNIKKYYNDFILDNNDDFIMDINDDELPLCEIDINLFGVAEEHCKDLCLNST